MRQRGSIPVFLAAFVGVGLFAGRDSSAAPIQYNVTDLGVSSATSSNDGMFSGGSLNDAGQVSMNVDVPSPSVGAGGLGVELYNSFGPKAGQVSMIVPPSPNSQPTYRLSGASDGTVADFGPIPSGTSAGVFHGQSINSQGVIAGYLDNGDAALDNNGKIQDLGRLAGSFRTSADFVNDAGTAVGSAGFSGIVEPLSNHPVLFNEGQVYELNNLLTQKLNGQLTTIDGLNNLGQILVESYPLDAAPRFYLLTPTSLPEPTPPQTVPEPSTWMILGVGLAVVGFRSRKKRGTTSNP
jgi:hypothetical protein